MSAILKLCWICAVSKRDWRDLAVVLPYISELHANRKNAIRL